MTKVKFLKSPTAPFALGYSAGQEGTVADDLAKKLVEQGYAIEVAEKATSARKPKRKTTD